MLLSIVLLQACGSATTESAVKKDSAVGDPKETDSGSSGPVTLTFTGPNGTDEFNARYGDYIRKRFPEYTISFLEKTDTLDIPGMVASGAQIDIVFSTIGGELEDVINTNLQYDIDPLMKKHTVDLSRFDPAPVDAMKTLAGGKMYGLPVLNNVMVMYYNKDLFDKFGVPYPKDGMTWDETLELSKKLTRTEGGKSYLGLVVSPSHYLRMNQYSLPLVDPKTGKSTAGNEKWKTIYNTVFIGAASEQSYKDWILNQGEGGELPAKKQFTKDKNLAMFIQLSQLFNAQPELASMNWDMVSLPVFKDLPRVGSQVYPTYLNISTTSKFKDQAMEVVKYMASDEHQMERSQQGDMTILKNPDIQNALGSATRFKGKNFKAVEVNQVAPSSPKTKYDDVAQDEFERVLPAVSVGSMDINTALRTVQEAADKAIAAKQ